MDGTAETSGPERIFRLLYRSRNRIPAGRRQAELGTLFSTARSSNKEQQITGAPPPSRRRRST